MPEGYRKEYLLVFALLLGCASILLLIAVFGWTLTWQTLNVPSMSPPFADMRTVQGALDTTILGLDPQIENPGDPWGRRMNYPKVWLYIGEVLHLQNELAFIISVSAFILAYLICCARILIRTPSVLVLALIFSASSLLAMERGNNDLLAFALLYVAASTPAFVGVVMISLAMVLKLFPLLGLGALLHARRAFVGLVLMSAVILYFLWPELGAIRAGTPVSGWLSFGSASTAAFLTNISGVQVPHVLISLLLVLAAIGLFIQAPSSPELFDDDAALEQRRLFITGAGVYCGTFILASNWDYRLIFLILCVPHIIRMRNPLLRWGFGAAMLVASNQIVLVKLGGTYGLSLNILAKGALFVGLAAVLLPALRTQILTRRGAA